MANLINLTKETVIHDIHLRLDFRVAKALVEAHYPDNAAVHIRFVNGKYETHFFVKGLNFTDTWNPPLRLALKLESAISDIVDKWEANFILQSVVLSQEVISPKLLG